MGHTTLQVDSETNSCWLTKPMQRKKNAQFIIAKINKALRAPRSSTTAYTAIALCSYLTNKWCVEANIRLQYKPSNEKSSFVEKMRTLLAESSDGGVQFKLKNRGACLEATQNLVEAVETTIAQLRKSEQFLYAEIIEQCHLLNACDELTRYSLDLHYEAALKAFDEAGGQTMRDIICGFMEIIPQDGDILYYHNTAILLERYRSIMLHKNDTADAAVNLLYSAINSDAHKISQKTKDCSEVEHIIHFLCLTHDAIREIKTFPFNGPQLYTYLCLRYEEPDKNLPPLTNFEIAKKMHIHHNSIKPIKHMAIFALSALLWGAATIETISDVC